MNVITKTVSLPDGRTISIETGKVAKQADGSVMLRMGNTVLLATVCAAKDAVPGTDFMPLQVDYRELYASAGRFPGGFTRREGKPGDNEILTSRLVDRVLRPLFPSNYHAEVYVNVLLFSADGVDQPDALAGFAASAALACSDIPFECPISEVRVARINGEYVINPTFAQMKEADMDIMVGASADNIMMVEGEMKEVSEQDLLGALKAAMDAIRPMCLLQTELSKELGKDVKREYDHEVNDEELREQMNKELYQPAYDVTKQALEKHARAEAFEKILSDFKEAYAAAHSDLDEDALQEKNDMMDRYYHDVMRDAMRRCILDEGIRLDGRKTTDIRPIWCEVSPLPIPHGSSIFTRGETQSLTTCTLGTKLDEKLVDDVLERSYMRFLLHYNFPPFCTGEAKAQRSVGRREIGHGHLAWRALKGQIPEDFPYTVRLVSEILESNGSSSMATVCAGTLALMDAGVPMKKPVSGIAMGLIKNPGEDKYAVLSDILGDEDHLGDMDFKTTGTKDGLTATQMDIKCDGLSFDILEKALMQAKAGREHILGKLTETIAEPRPDLKPHVPRIVAFDIPKEFIGAVIGPGGKIIQQMQEDTGATITIDEIDGGGPRVFLHLLDNLSARANDSANELLGNIELLDARNLRLQFRTRLSNSVGDAVQNVLTTGFGLHQGLLQNIERQTVTLDIHLGSSQTILRTSGLEVHIAQVVLIAEDIGEHGILVFTGVLDETHGDSADGLLDGHTGIHQCEGTSADGSHRAGTV